MHGTIWCNGPAERVRHPSYRWRRPDPRGEHLQHRRRGDYVCNIRCVHCRCSFSIKHWLLTIPGIDSDIDAPCLRAWRLTDPRDDRTRILASKDPLLAGSCDWILDDAAFAQWWEDDESRILWIHGDPGKGKTMLMMALTEEIARRVGATPDQKAATAFFFCQNTVPELSNAAAVVRGLTFLLATEQPALRRHLARKYAEAGERLFEGLNVLPSLWTTLADMAQDASVSRLYLLVDALDECEQDLLRTFLDLATSPTASCKIKWVFTSRNIQSIQEQLLHTDFSRHTSLEVNSSRVSEAVVSFIRFKVDRLAAQKRYSTEIQQQVRLDMEARADGTFLWVALVCKELERVTARKTLKTMQQVPAGLPQLYQRMLEQIAAYNDEEDSKFCEALLRTITIAQRPLDQAEIGHLAGLPPDVIDDLQAIEELVSSCGSFLTMRKGIVSFVHQSAKDFFTTGHGCSIFLYGQPQVHEELARRLLGSMWRSLTTDICGVRWPGTQVHEAVGDKTVKIWDASSGACLHTLDVGKVLFHLSFDPDGSRLDTEIGSFEIQSLETSSIIGPVEPARPLCVGTGFSLDGIWIQHAGSNLLWVPSEYRPSRLSISGTTVGVGVGSGRVWVCSIDP
jgi:hypothetical protein